VIGRDEFVRRHFVIPQLPHQRADCCFPVPVFSNARLIVLPLKKDH